MTTATLGVTSISETLVANTADTINLTGSGQVEVINLDATAIIWLRWDGTTAVSGAADNVPVPPSSSWKIPATVSTVSLISTGTPLYCVNRIV